MAELSRDVLIIGAGVAGASVAKELRHLGFTGSVLLLGRELDAPYERPPATKDYLAGKIERSAATWLSEQWCEEHDVELRLRTSVLKLDTAAKVAKLQGGDEVSYEHVVVATGANVRRMRIDGTDLEGLHYIRALRNADTIKAELEQVQEAVAIGGSYIGCEAAATLTELGKKVTILMQEDHPMQNGFGEQAGRYVRSVLEGKGITILGGQEVEKLTGDDERVEQVVTADGTSVAAQLVVIGVGAVPDVMTAKAAGLELGEKGGVVVDSHLRASVDGVWAAGDCAEFESVIYGGHLRIEHQDVAIEQGRTVARNITGKDEPFSFVPYFWSDLSDWVNLQYVGNASRGWDEELVRGSIDDGAFSVWYLQEGKLVATLSIGRGEDLIEARRLIADGAVADALRTVVPDLGAELTAL
ncbi:MAG: FAD-dependent oxidoreductase [Solirubrobacteraceae bacterium]|nr:FAD-dependent oxidoreductase [Solirubrobacteraceae bacterium]